MCKSHPVELRNKRLEQARTISLEPDTTLTDVAKAWKISKPAASTFFKRHDPELGSLFRGRKCLANQFSGRDALWRLKFIRQRRGRGDGDYRIAKLLGISQSGLIQWERRWASDGLDQAIEDLEDE